jgi:hypothetical protein
MHLSCPLAAFSASCGVRHFSKSIFLGFSPHRTLL